MKKLQEHLAEQDEMWQDTRNQPTPPEGSGATPEALQTTSAAEIADHLDRAQEVDSKHSVVSTHTLRRAKRALRDFAAALSSSKQGAWTPTEIERAHKTLDAVKHEHGWGVPRHTANGTEGSIAQRILWLASDAAAALRSPAPEREQLDTERLDALERLLAAQRRDLAVQQDWEDGVWIGEVDKGLLTRPLELGGPHVNLRAAIDALTGAAAPSAGEPRERETGRVIASDLLWDFFADWVSDSPIFSIMKLEQLEPHHYGHDVLNIEHNENVRDAVLREALAHGSDEFREELRLALASPQGEPRIQTTYGEHTIACLSAPEQKCKCAPQGEEPTQEDADG